MKKWSCYLLLAIITLLSVTAKAQTPEDFKNTTPGQRAQWQTDLMKNKLQLTDNQTPQVAAINLKYAKQMEPVIKGDGGKLAKFREAKRINEAKDADLKKVFTTDQYAKWEQAKEEMKEAMKKKMQEHKQQQ